MKKQIQSLYDYCINLNKKLKIVCDWDEVIQSAWPYALYLGTLRNKEKESKFYGTEYKKIDFVTFFNNYWQTWKSSGIDNPSDIYHQMPFLTIAEDLLKLLKEDKVEKLIFLSSSDERKIEVFKETFQKFDKIVNEEWGKVIHKISLRLLSDEYRYKTKHDWIRDNAPGFDLFIDDDPKTCKGVLDEFISFGLCRNCRKTREELTDWKEEDWENKRKICPKCPTETTAVLTPYYPILENKHDERVIFLKQEVSNLKKEDFKKNRLW